MNFHFRLLKCILFFVNEFHSTLSRSYEVIPCYVY